MIAGRMACLPTRQAPGKTLTSTVPFDPHRSTVRKLVVLSIHRLTRLHATTATKQIFPV